MNKNTKGSWFIASAVLIVILFEITRMSGINIPRWLDYLTMPAAIYGLYLIFPRDSLNKEAKK